MPDQRKGLQSKLRKKLTWTLEQGGKLLLGGKRNGAFYEPTVIADVPKTADVAKDMEIFGPVVPIIGFDTDEEAVEIANSSKFGLSSCVFSRDESVHSRLHQLWKPAVQLLTAQASTVHLKCHSVAGNTAA